jgi:hypothetical protein
MSDTPTPPPPGPEPTGPTPPPDRVEPTPQAPAYGTPTPPTQPGYGAPTPPPAPGYGAAPQQPSYGAPTYGAPVTDPYAPVATKTNGMAIAALISAFFIGLLGIILGAVSLGQIKKGNGGGKGLAIAGIVVGALQMVSITGIIVASVLTAMQADTAGQVVASAWSSAVASLTPYPGSSDDPSASEGTSIPDFTLTQTLVAGDCFADIPQYNDMHDAVHTDCASPHSIEVLYTFKFPSALSNTGDPVIKEQVSACFDKMGSMVSSVSPKLVDASDSRIFPPSARQWNSGSKTAYCVLEPADQFQKLTGSVVAGTYKGTASS